MRIAIAFGLLLPMCLAAEVRYNVVPLVPDDQGIGNAFAGTINQFGDATGVFLGPIQENHGFLYTDQGGFSELQGAGDNFFPTGINNARQVAGYGGPFGTTLLLRYTPGIGFLALGTFGGRENETHRINNRGQVVGFSSTSAGNEIAFRYTDGVGLENLGTLPGAQISDARAINNLGCVTGSSGNRAFLYRDGLGMTDIGPGSGWAINDAGVVVGESSFQPVLYMNGQAIPLVGSTGRANSINNHGVVVGTIDAFGFTRAFIWSEQEGSQDLNSLLDPNSGWFLAGAGQINDNGQIVGFGFSAERGDLFTPWRLDPIRPRLKIALEGTNVVLSWSPHWPGLVLETAPHDSQTNWQAVPGGTDDPVILPATGPGQIFRLTQYGSLDPRLTAAVSGTNLVISWAPPWPDYALECASTMPPVSWEPVPGATDSPVTLALSQGPSFFRLRKSGAFLSWTAGGRANTASTP